MFSCGKYAQTSHLTAMLCQQLNGVCVFILMFVFVARCDEVLLSLILSCFFNVCNKPLLLSLLCLIFQYFSKYMSGDVKYK